MIYTLALSMTDDSVAAASYAITFHYLGVNQSMSEPTPTAARYRVGNAVRHALLAAAMTASAIASTQILAAEDEGPELEAVVVTGSRIASANMASSSPIVSVTNEDIKTGGRIDVTDMLNQLPQMNSNSLGQDLGNKTSGLSTAGGVATADLRGLGPNRTLVLVDGRRLGTGSPQTAISSPAPDLDQIPAALIERVEVVTGGASAVYGSDALAGVVNFIMKKNFEGLQLDAQMSGNWHDNNNSFAQERLAAANQPAPTGSGWDGHTVNLSVTAGANIMDGRGNVTGFFSYQSMNPVASSRRDFGSCQLNYTEALDDVECGGSGNSNYFEPQNKATNTGPPTAEGEPGGLQDWSVLGNQFVPWGTEGTNPPQIFNSQKNIYMQRQDERYNAGFIAHVDVNDHVRPYAEFSFMNDRTHQEVAPTALFSSSNITTATGFYAVNCSNPFLSAQQAALICSPEDIDADRADPGSVSQELDIGRRNVEGGARQYEYEHTNYRMVLGTKGDIAEGWKYDAYGQYFYTGFNSFNGKDISWEKLSNALQVMSTPDGPACISGGSCVPYNIFSDGGVTNKALEYMYTPGTASGNTELKTLHADFTGDLGVYGLKLPTADEGVAVNVGYEYRAEHLQYSPDAAIETGLLAGVGGAQPSIDQGVSVNEGFAELRLPIMQGRPGVYDLVADAGYRYSDYSTGVTTDTYKFELQYAPMADLRFRGSYNHAIRAPSITELYVPQSTGKISFGGMDPCSPVNGVAAVATLTQCMNTGVTAAQYGNGLSTNTIPQGTANQLTQLQGGNTALKPETADTYTVGVTWRPEMLAGFTGSLDYYHIKMKDLIGTADATLSLNTCLDTGDTVSCNQISRHPITGTLNGASVESGGYIIQTNVNIAAQLLDGIDLQAAYRMNIGNLGALRFSLNGAYLLTYKTTPQPGGESYDCAGLFGATCQTVNPEWRHSLRTTWELPQDLSVSLTWRFLGGTKQDDDAPIFRATLPDVSYLDLSGSWDVSKHLQVRGGINNILDKDPPIVPSDIASGGAPNYYEFYDGLGRQAFVAVTAKF